MSLRRSILKAVYPLLMWWTNFRRRNVSLLTNKEKRPPYSFYELAVELNDGTTLQFSTLKGKKVMLVNTASDCGYTNQYADLQQLYENNKDNLVVIGFPANDFKQQEKGTDEEIAVFCQKNYGVSFPLARKTVVKRTSGQNKVYQWLNDPMKNGWNSKPPSWNFSKYLVSENGVLINYFGPSISPLSDEIKKTIK